MALKLEVFNTFDNADGSSTIVLDSMLLEETKLASYESGFAAGWEDATAAQTGDQARLQVDLAQNLQNLSFTYHEARDHVLRSVEPLLTEIVNKLLPEIAQNVLAPTILQILLPIAEKLAENPVTLVINPAARQAIENLIEKVAGLPIAILEEPSLSEGQAYIRMGETESQVNLDRAAAEISAAVRGFFDRPEKEQKHG